MYKDIDEYKKSTCIDSIKHYIHKLDTRKYDVYKLNPSIFGKFGGVDYKVSDLDIILSIAQEERYSEEECNHLEYEYEESQRLENIDISDLDIYDKVKGLYEENQRLENIVKGEVLNFSYHLNNHRDKKNVIMKLVRANSNYKDLKNKKQLSSCVTSVLNKTSILYTFDLTQRVCEIFIACCSNNFNYVESLIENLKDDIDDTINKLNDVSFNKGLQYVEYIDKLEAIKFTLEEMEELDNFKYDDSFKYDLLEYIGLNTEKNIISKYINIKTTPRKYESDYRTGRKESIRRKALELKSEGIRNNEIARKLGKSKGYISELLNGKK